jgi:hypothetical protein
MKIPTKLALPFIWFKSMLQDERQARLPFNAEERTDLVVPYSTDILQRVTPIWNYQQVLIVTVLFSCNELHIREFLLTYIICHSKLKPLLIRNTT